MNEISMLEVVCINVETINWELNMSWELSLSHIGGMRNYCLAYKCEDSAPEEFPAFSKLRALVSGIVSGARLIPAVLPASAVVPWETDGFTWVARNLF
ncbi:hypothetical protein L1987_32443 [Smallanthus sonchifolius]|uniref:Uncharacterized protein n=1 Tax=Smallanthus sonchifolius TaxID=185202 RepID=A0ACB9HN14_9ASTR|nr:hypothetical protein L1987_32443 [Smallanthus sonchifolius]